MATRVGYVGTEAIGDVLTKANYDKGPAGLVAYVSTTSNSSAAATVTTYTGLNPTITAGTSRLYKITIGCTTGTQVGVGASQIQIWDMTGSVALQTGSFSVAGAAAGNYPGTTLSFYHAPSAGSQQYAFRFLSSATSIQVNAGATSPAYIMVEDVGPAF